MFNLPGSAAPHSFALKLDALNMLHASTPREDQKKLNQKRSAEESAVYNWPSLCCIITPGSDHQKLIDLRLHLLHRKLELLSLKLLIPA